MSYAKAVEISASEIPVIDAGGDAGEVAAEIYKALTGVGFFYVRNHGLSEAVLARARAAGLAFFRRPEAEKARVAMSGAHRGYLGLGDSHMPGSRKTDLKESFIWGPEPAADGDPLRAANLWPEAPTGFREAVTPFLEEGQRCAVRLLRAFARALDAPEDLFVRRVERPVSRASVTYYLPQPPELGENVFGVAPHTDFGCLTLLAQDEVGGLQVLNGADQWVTAHPIPGTIVVNVGDLMARWSNDRFRSTPHRVVNASGRERMSLVLAYDPDAETVVDPAPLLPAGTAAKYPPITCGDYITSRFDQSFAYRQ